MTSSSPSMLLSCVPPRKTPEPDPSVEERPAASPPQPATALGGVPGGGPAPELPVRVGDRLRLGLEQRISLVHGQELEDAPDDGPTLRRHRADLAPEDRAPGGRPLAGGGGAA